MNDCNICVNAKICKYKNDTKELDIEIAKLNEKYKDRFNGKILLKCDYFIDTNISCLTRR